MQAIVVSRQMGLLSERVVSRQWDRVLGCVTDLLLVHACNRGFTTGGFVTGVSMCLGTYPRHIYI
jgi:hypothetical protein